MKVKPSTSQGAAKVKIKKAHKKIKAKKSDSSILHKPVDTSVNSFSAVLNVFNDGTSEIKRVLDYECDLIYECKVCRSLFRSVTNLVMHKRTYCLQMFKDTKKSMEEFKEQTLIMANSRHTLSTRMTMRKDILALLDGFNGQKTCLSVNGPFILREMDQTSQSLLNSFNHEGKNPTLERQATLGPDGQILNSKSSEYKILCPFCSLEPKSQLDLDEHLSRFHLDKKEYFICPCCKNYFANSWSIHKHMCKDHKKTSEETRKLRPQIVRKQIRHDETGVVSKKSKIDKDVTEFKENGNVSYTCKMCGMNFPKIIQLMAHETSCIQRRDRVSMIKIRTDYIKQVMEDPFLPPKNPQTKATKSAQKVTKLENILQNIQVLKKRKLLNYKTSETVDLVSDEDSDNRIEAKSNEIQQKMNGDLNAEVVENGKTDEFVEPESTVDDEVSSPETENDVSTSKTHDNRIKENVDFAKRKCRICLKAFSKIQFVQRHVANHFNIVKNLCKLCDYKCYLRSDMLSHLLKVHKMKTPHCLDHFEKVESPTVDEQDTTKELNGVIDCPNDIDKHTSPYDSEMEELKDKQSDEKINENVMEVILGVHEEEIKN